MSYYGRADAADPPTPSGGRHNHKNSRSFHNNNNNNSGNSAQLLDQGKIFVGGLSWQTTEESLRWHFEQYGKVASVDVMKDRVTGDPRGFAFVVFADGASVDAVMKEASHEINHKVVDVKRAQARGVAPPSIHRDHQSQPGQEEESIAPPSDRRVEQQSRMTPEEQGNKVFVGGIPPHIDSVRLKEIFEEFGAVADAIVMIEQTSKRSRGFGFVTFEAGSDGAQKAIERQPLPIEGRSVEVKLATPKGDQRRVAPAAGPRNMGLRAGMSSSSTKGEYAGLAVAYGRNGWKAGYGSYAFGKAGFAVQGWETSGPVPKKYGFSFSMLKENDVDGDGDDMPPAKKARQ